MSWWEQGDRKTDAISAGFLKDAIESKDTKRVMMVLASVDPNAKDLAGIPIIIYAIRLPDSNEKRDILVQLLDSGANINKDVLKSPLLLGGKKMIKRTHRRSTKFPK